MIFKLFILIISFAYYAVYAVDFEGDWQRYKGIPALQERLHRYLGDTAALERHKSNFENLSPDFLKNWLNPLLANKTAKPAFRSQYLLELFTNLHDSAPNDPAKHRLADIQHYWMSSQNRHMPLSNRIAGLDEQKAMVNALDRRVNSLIRQHFTAESDPEDIYQIVIGDLADSYLGKAESSVNLRHRKHYNICYLVSALMVLDKLLVSSIDTPSRARDFIFARFPEKVEDSVIKRAQTLMGLADKTPQAPLDYKPYLESYFAVQVKTDAAPVLVPPPVRVAPPMPRPIVTAAAEPLRPYNELETALSNFSGLSAVDKNPMEEAFGITEYKALRQMIAHKNQGDRQATAWLDTYGRNYKDSYPELFVEVPIAMPKPLPMPVAPVISEDAKRRFLADGKERGRESYPTEDGQQLLLYEVLADGNCGLYSLSVRREAGLAKVQELLRKLATRTLGEADFPARILAAGKAEEFLRNAEQQLSAKDYNEHVSIPTLRVLAYSMLRSNVKVWSNDYGEFEEDAADFRWQTDGLPTIHLMLKGAHYDHLVPAADVVARMKARAVENTLPRARLLVQQAWEEGTEERKHVLQRQAADLQFNAATTPLAQ